MAGPAEDGTEGRHPVPARQPTDTIVAVATPPGRGGIGILRVSGAGAPGVAAALLGRVPAPRRAQPASFHDAHGAVIDSGLALFFPAPRSYTGEDVLELHAHGSPVVLEMLIERALALGARRARPGEFTERAFLNGKLDLAQAEAVAALIESGTEAAARAAVRSLRGEFSTRVQGLVEALTQLRTWIEAAIDFPAEEIDFLADERIAQRLAALLEGFEAVTRSARQGQLLTEGLTVVLAGRPNAGKSSLMNRLAGYDAAIVTPVPGTTRDVLRERLSFDGLPLHLIDTAGLRSTQEHAALDAIESEGIRRARGEIGRADHVLFVIDAAEDPEGQGFEAERAGLPSGVPVSLVLNKVDLLAPARPAASKPDPGKLADCAGDLPRLAVSALTGEGIDALRAHLKACAGYVESESGALAARGRHLDALKRARVHVETAARELAESHAGELVAEELRLAQQVLGEITGEVTTDELLGRIFAGFCIGK